MSRGAPMEVAFLLAGLVFVAFGLLVLYSEAQARRGALEVPGEVIGFSIGQSASNGASYHSVAQYAGTDGRTRYVEGSVGSSSPLGSLGDAVTVLVQPDDPERATIKSSLTSVVGAAIALMGLASCIVFFAVFRLSAISIAGAVAVVGMAAYKLGSSVREKPMSLQAWRDYKKAVLRPRVFTDDTKQEIRWAFPWRHFWTTVFGIIAFRSFPIAGRKLSRRGNVLVGVSETVTGVKRVC